MEFNHHFTLACFLSMIFSENRYPLFGIMLLSMIFSENRYPLFGIMLFYLSAAARTCRVISQAKKVKQPIAATTAATGQAE
jgi:hypothetical protein